MTEESNYRTDVTPIWCPGCGGFSLLSSLTKTVLPNLGIPNHRTLVVSGIGCSSRIPGYVDTYGFNSLHGRAVVIAQGAKLASPDLTVLAIGGDGDFFGLPRSSRSDSDYNIVLLDRFDVGLLRGGLGADESFFRDDHGRLAEHILEGSLRRSAQCAERMSYIFSLKRYPLIGQGGKFDEDAFRLTNSPPREDRPV